MLPPAAARGRRRPTPPATSARTSSAPASTSRSSCTPAPAPTSAARRPRCSTRSRAAAASRGCKPPFPAVAGLYARPTVVNNVESIASVPCIVRNGADWFAVDGHREVPGLRHLLAVRPRRPAPASTRPRSASRCASCSSCAGGIRDGHELKFWTPGGSSTPMLHRRAPRRPAGLRGRRRGRLDARHPGAADLRRDHLRGAGGAALDRVLQARVLRQVHAVPRGHLLAGADPASGSRRARAREDDLDKLLDICDNILGRSFCALGDGATSPITVVDPVLPRRVRRAPHRTAAARSTRPPRPLFATAGATA